MERDERWDKEYNVLRYLSCIPNKMIGLHDQENITEFVLHDLCCAQCFNLPKAAYFIDNPDFNCFKGVVGFSREEAYTDSAAIWNSPSAFTVHMRGAQFNNKVRQVLGPSLKKSHVTDETVAQKLARDLGFSQVQAYSWNLKHDNHGLLLIEHGDVDLSLLESHLKNGLTLLSFCPIF